MIQKLSSDPLIQYLAAVLLGFYLTVLAGTALEKFSWYRNFMLGKEENKT